MRKENFEHCTSSLIQHCWDLLDVKGNQYGSKNVDDRLIFFKQLSAIQINSPEEVLMGLASKHWLHLKQLVANSIDCGELEEWQEVLSDIINYMALLWAMVNEKEKETVDEED